MSSDYVGLPSWSLLTVGILLKRFSFLCYRLRWVPRLYTPAACPTCNYPNDDETFTFCEQCDYRRKPIQGKPVKERLSIDELDIAQRLQHLSQQRSSSRYVRQKLALESAFAHFLASLTSAKSLASALPEDVIAFLVWKDRAGKT